MEGGCGEGWCRQGVPHRERVSMPRRPEGSPLRCMGHQLVPGFVLDSVWTRHRCMGERQGRNRKKIRMEIGTFHFSQNDWCSQAEPGFFAPCQFPSVPFSLPNQPRPLFHIVLCLRISSRRPFWASPGSLLHTLLSLCFLILSLHFPLLNFTPLSSRYTPYATLINQCFLPLHHFFLSPSLPP